MKRLAIFALMLCSLPAWATWGVNNAGQANFNSTSAAVTFTNALHNPSTIVVVCRAAVIDPITTPSDTAGNVFTVAISQQTVYTGQPRDTLAIYIANNTHTTASDVVTCFASTVGIAAYEFTGCTTCALLDGTSVISTQSIGSGGTNSAVWNSFTTSTNGDLIFATEFDSGVSSSSAGTSPITFAYTGETFEIARTEYGTQTSAGSIAPTETLNGSGIVWGGMALGLSPAPGGVKRLRGIVIHSP